MGRVVVLTIITVALIYLEYKKRKNLKKSLIAIAIFGYILLVGYSGFITTRAIRPIFFIHILSVISSYFVLIYYLLKDKLYWQILLLPLFTIGSYFLLDFVDGSRYET